MGWTWMGVFAKTNGNVYGSRQYDEAFRIIKKTLIKWSQPWKKKCWKGNYPNKNKEDMIADEDIVKEREHHFFQKVCKYEEIRTFKEEHGCYNDQFRIRK